MSYNVFSLLNQLKCRVVIPKKVAKLFCGMAWIFSSVEDSEIQLEQADINTRSHFFAL
ncbi:MAG: hypothetical protein ACI8ZM_001642 [Crocinitomix sp.]|jgi:hypothetical protein